MVKLGVLALLALTGSFIYPRLLQDVDQEKKAAQLETLVRDLESKDGRVRSDARRNLEEFLAKAEMPQVVTLLEHENPVVRIQAIITLESRGGKQTASRIAEKLQDKDWRVRGAAAYRLGRLGADECLPQISDLLAAEKEAGALRMIIFALARLNVKDTEYEHQISQFLESDHQIARASAADALGKIKTTKYAAKIANLLRDEVDFVRQAAARNLGKLGQTRFAEQVSSLLEDEIYSVRLEAVRSLGELGAKESVPQLIKLLEREERLIFSYSIYTETLLALEKIDGRDQITKRLDHEFPHLRIAAVVAITRLDAEELVPQIAKLLSDQDETVQAYAAYALGKFRAKEFAPQIARLLENQDRRIRDLAVDALVNIGARDQIKKRLGHQDPHVRESAAQALKLLDEMKK